MKQFDIGLEVIPEAERSEKHEKWKRKLFDKMRNDRYHRFTTKTVRVMMVAAVLWALLLTAFVIPSSREFIIDNFEIFSTYKLTESNDNSVNGEITVGYIPDGFELESEENYSKHLVKCYTSSNGNSFIIHKYPSSMKVDFNTENVETETININSKTYTYCFGENNMCNVIWNENDYIYRINGTISKNELLKIAATVK